MTHVILPERCISELHVGRLSGDNGSDTATTSFRIQAAAACSNHENDELSRDAAKCSSSGDCYTLDRDGDLQPARRCTLTLRHALSTTVADCGSQLWMGGCALADWLLAPQHRQHVQGQVMLELGAGAGLASIAAAHAGATVLCTDANAAALTLAAANAASNGVDAGTKRGMHGAVHVRHLDWLQLFDARLWRLTDADVLQLLNGGIFDPGTAAAAASAAGQPDNHWSQADLELLARTSLLLAADVVYNETLTDAFCRAARALSLWMAVRRSQRHQCDAGLPKVLLALLRRVNFTLRALAPAAPAHEHFLSYMRVISDDGDGSRGLGCSELLGNDQEGAPLFQARRLRLAPRLLDYEHCDGLELWELTALSTGM